MQPQLGQTQYLKRSINGEDIYSILPYGGNTPYGYTPVSQDEFISGTQKRLAELQANPSLQSGSGDWGNIAPLQKNLQDAISNSGASSSGYRDPSFSKFNPNGQPTEANFTDAEKARVSKIPSNLGGGAAPVPAPNLGGASGPTTSSLGISSPASNTSSSGQTGTNNGAPSSPVVSGNTVSFNGQTYTLSSPAEAAFLQNAILPFLDTMKQQGLAINPNLNLGPEVINQILEKAKATVHPEYAQQIAGVQEDFKRNVGTTADAYGNAIASSEQNFKTNLGNARENYAGNGLTFSGQRGLGETNMQSDQNRSLSGLGSQYGSQLGEYGRSLEKNLGTAGMNNYQLPSLKSYSADLSGNGGFNSTGSVNTGYTPGTYQLGTIPQSETAAALALRNQNVDEASKRKSAGLSFNDLYQ